MKHSPPPWQDYLFAAGAAGAALLVRLGLSQWLGSHAPFLPFIAAVVLAAWRGGLGPGLFVAALGGVLGAFLMPAEQGWRIDAGNLLHLALFGGTAALISLLSEHLHKARRRLAANEEELSHRLQELQAILESTSAVVYLMDCEDRFIHINRRWQQVFGLVNEQVAGRSIYEFFPAAVADQLRDNNKKVLGGGAPVEFEEIIPHQDGPHTYITVKVPIFDPSGAPYAICGVSTDITERKRTEREKEQALATLRSLIHSAPVGIALLGDDLRFDLINEPLAEMNGIPADAHLGRSVGEVVPGVLEAVEPLFRQVLETGQSVKDMLVEGETPKAPGVHRTWLESWFPVTDSMGGKPSGVGVVVQEVTDRVRAERQLRESQEALKEADRKKDEFLATLAHELRNPLAPLRNSLELVRLAGGRVEAQTLTRMDRQLNQLVRLIDDLLDVSRIASGKLELRKERIELAAVVEAAVETSRPVIEGLRHTLTVEVPLGIVVDADRIRLAQVFSNLLSNAAKYTQPGGEIRLIASQRDGEAVVRVEDSGVGIPADMLTGVFELFAQVDRSLERSQGGLGIGLTLATRLSEMHGGNIQAESHGEGRGSTFTVRLPAVGALPASSSNPGEAAEKGGAAARRRVLVADDNEDSALSLAELLELKGNDVQTASNGLEAVERAEVFRPDVIVLDIGMPMLNGYDVARKIREKPWGGDVRLIALTGWGQEEDKRRARESGFDHHLVKPVDVGALETLLNRA